MGNSNSPSFVEHAVELLSSLGPVGARAMFGGHLVFSRGLSVGLIDDDRLYLKVDEVTRAEFQAAGSEPFVYQSRNGPMEMSYWSLPEEAIDDPDTAAKWARLAGEAAARADAGKKAKGSGAKKKGAPAAGRKPAAAKKAQAGKKAPARKAKKAPRAEKRG